MLLCYVIPKQGNCPTAIPRDCQALSILMLLLLKKTVDFKYFFVSNASAVAMDKTRN